MIVPSVERGNGTGHLLRCIDLCGKLESSYIYLPRSGTETERGQDELEEFLQRLPKKAVVHSMPPPGRFECIVFDTRRTKEEMFYEIFHSSVVLSIDEGGGTRSRFDYLIDTLPKPASFSRPNISSPAFLGLPSCKKESPSDDTERKDEPFRSVLVSFGGEDPAGLTEQTVRFLIEKGFFGPGQITAVRGPLMGGLALPKGVTVLDRPEGLAALLSGYDLVCTAFGLTAYEAAAAGAAVLCVHPSRYHARLGSIAGFPFGGTGTPRLRRFRKALAEPLRLRSRSRAVLPAGETRSRDLAEFLNSFVFPDPPVCPVCRARGGPAFMRFRDRTIVRCSGCGVLYQILFTGAAKSYGKEYFFSEYKARYGKTYLEDFNHIKELALKRLRVVRRLLAPGRLLDVGCAYGPFLAAAAEAGYDVFGIDLSESAVRFVREQLKLPALAAPFEPISPSSLPGEFRGRCDIITMWYVFEHFRDSAEAMRKVHELLEPGGIFALSTPNAGGISARGNPEGFFGANPEDHFTLWTPKIVKKVLPKFGFTVKKIRVTGHHPERFRVVRKEYGMVYRIFKMISRIFRLGDTFEVYAVRDYRKESFVK